jgi:hypothetical protein
MGIKSFLRRWLGFVSEQTTVKTTVGRAYQQPVPVRITLNPQMLINGKRAHTARPKTVAGFYEKAGGYAVFSELEKSSNPDLWLKIINDTNSRTRERQYRIECMQTQGRTSITKIFPTINEAIRFKRNLLAHHERMKAKAAKGGLNNN